MTTEEIREGLRGAMRDARRDPYVIIDGIIVALAIIVVLSLVFGLGVRT